MGATVNELEQLKEKHNQFFTQYLQMFSSKQFEQWAEQFWHPSGKFIVVYPVEGFPRLAGDGRAMILNNMKGLGSKVESIETTDLLVYQTTEPNLFIVTYKMQALYSGGEYSNEILSFVKLQNDKIIEITEYYNIHNYEGFLKGIGVKK